MIGIIILSVLLTFSIALFIIYYRQVSDVNLLYINKPEDLDITWDLDKANEFNIPKILYNLEIPKGTRLYSTNPNEELYLDSYININTKKDGKITVSVTNIKTNRRSTRTYDRYGIHIADTRTRRRPRNCEIFLTPMATKMSWYCIVNYSKLVIEEEEEKKLEGESSSEIKFPLKVLQSTVYKYCTKYCFLECKKGCALKDAYRINSKPGILEKIDIYCERDCAMKDTCSEACLLYEIKSR